MGLIVTYRDRASCGLPAVNSSYAKLLTNPAGVVGVVVHHTVGAVPDYDHDGLIAGDPDDEARFMQYLKTCRPDLGLEVPYSYVVIRGATDDQATLCEGRGRGRQGAHTAGYNSTRIGVALAGDFTSQEPSRAMLEAIRMAGRIGLPSPKTAVPTIGHRDTKATACPGNRMYAHLPDVQPPFPEALTGVEALPAGSLELRAVLDAVFVDVTGYHPSAEQLGGWSVVYYGTKLVDPIAGFRANVERYFTHRDGYVHHLPDTEFPPDTEGLRSVLRNTFVAITGYPATAAQLLLWSTLPDGYWGPGTWGQGRYPIAQYAINVKLYFT